VSTAANIFFNLNKDLEPISETYRFIDGIRILEQIPEQKGVRMLVGIFSAPSGSTKGENVRKILPFSEEML
jgi:hypothetical protein